MSQVSSSRSAEEIIRIVESAKLHPDDLNPRVQEIHFHSDFGGGDRRLLELDPEVDKYLCKGSSLVIRGAPGDSAMICTEDSTFELKDAEISNSLLLLDTLYYPPGTLGSPTGPSKTAGKVEDEDSENHPDGLVVEQRQVRCISHSYLEMRRVRPNLAKIVHMLEPNSYGGKDNEQQINTAQLVSFEKLLSQVSASRNEITSYLKNLKHVEIDGFLRLVESDYLFRVLNFILNMVDEFSWSSKSIEKSTVIAQLSELEPNFILEKVFEWFFLPAQAATSGDDEDCLSIAEELYCMNDDAICNLFGEVILRRGGKFNLREFLKSWQETVPKGLKVSLRQLKNIAMVDETSSPPTIRYFPEFNLPPTTQDRLSALFEAKPKWKHDEIMPFISSLATSVQNASVLLTKFCRVTSPEGVKTYSAKYK